MSSQEISQSIQGLSDPMNRIYICLCQKKFTTYPGVYLHIKSKHSQFFEKYKKMKITRLFEKIKSSERSEVYKLPKLSEIDKKHKDISFNKKQEPKTKTPSPTLPLPKHKPNLNFQVRPSEHQNKPKEMFNIFNPNTDFGGKHPQMILQPPRTGAPLCWPHFQVPPYYHYQPFGMGPRPTIKIVLQKFLLEFNLNKAQLLKVMHDLMVYIDQNFESIGDPRTKDRLFLSYCDSFDTNFLMRLLERKIEEIDKEKQPTNQQESNSQKNILNQFKLWLLFSGLAVSTNNSQACRSRVEVREDHTNGYVHQEIPCVKQENRE